MSTERLHARPRRRETHFGDRVLWCFSERPPDVYGGFAAAARANPDGLALAFGDRRWTYAELEHEIARHAVGLSRLDVRPGDHVGLYLSNRPEFVLLFYALMRLGAVAVPIDVRLQGLEVGYIVDKAGVGLLIHEPETAERIATALSVAPRARAFPVPNDAELFADVPPAVDAGAPHAPAEEEPALILFTSGTSGRPKGAIITHLNVVHSALHHSGNLGLTEHDRSLVAVPLSHVTGLLCGVVAPLWTGGTLVVLPKFKASDFLAAAEAWRMTYAIMVPAMYNLCLRVDGFDALNLSAWRLGHYGGSPMPDATIEALARKVPALTMVNGYGATETCSPSVMGPVGLGRARPAGAIGLAMPCAEIAVMDPETGIEVETGETGELWIRGPMVSPGYWRDPEATAQGFVGGFWRSGDIGRIDADGNVFVQDRLKDVINRGGYKIYSAEVEAVLAHFPGLVEAATVGSPDPVLGERVHAFVTVSGPVAEADLTAFCSARLGDYKVPETWTISHDPLPRNSTGKIIKTDLRARLSSPTR